MLLLSWTVAVMSAVQLGAPQVEPTLRVLAAGCERIALVRVRELHNLPHTGRVLLTHLWGADDLPFAGLEVERMLLGPQAETELFVFSGNLSSTAEAQRLQVGESAVVFLEQASALRYAPARETRAQIDALARGRTAWMIRPGGVWHIDAQGKLILPASRTAALAGSAEALDLQARMRALELVLELEFPRLDVALITNGGQPYGFQIAADGRVTGSWEAQLTTEQSQTLWGTIQSAEFMSLPKQVGGSSGPCLTAMDVEVVTRHARKSVGIVLGAIADIENPVRRADTERALRVWNAIPIPGGYALR